jgi:SnoaL-like domain
MDDAIAHLLDERAAKRVMLRYARGVDDRDWDQVRSCFAPEASVQGTGFSGARDEYLERLLPGVERYGVTMHTIGNQLVELDGDSARTETDLVARHFGDAEGRDEELVIGVRYLDRLRRDGDDWVIVHREVRRLWSRP